MICVLVVQLKVVGVSLCRSDVAESSTVKYSANVGSKCSTGYLTKTTTRLYQWNQPTSTTALPVSTHSETPLWNRCRQQLNVFLKKLKNWGPGFESQVAPLFHWVATLGKLFTHIAFPVSQLQETVVQKGVFNA